MERISNIWIFLRSRNFFLHILGAIAFYAACVLLFAFFVIIYTKHGESITVPDLREKTFDEVVRLLDKSKLEYTIADSVYNENKPALMVIDQNPGPGTSVKEYRTIYLTVNSISAPRIKMPDLKDASLKQATMILESYGMKLGNLIHKPDLAENVVLDQLYNGTTIAPGTEIKKGSRVDLVVGDGLGQTQVEVPNLAGLTLREARFVLEGSSLNLGAVVADETVKGDSLDAIVYQQVPEANDESVRMMNIGEGVDVFVTSANHYNKSPDQ